MTEKDSQLQRMRRRIQELEEAQTLLSKEVEERNETIGQKEARIFEVKQKNQELEKFRFVLEYKLSELRAELEPKENSITDIREQIKDMDEELQRTLRNSEELRLKIADRDLKISMLQKELKLSRSQVTEKEKFIRMFVGDLHRLYSTHVTGDVANEGATTSTTAVHALAGERESGLRQLYLTYVTHDTKRRITKEDQERMQELARQRQYMERSMGILKQKATHGEKRGKIEVHRKVAENAALISELNMLRRQNKEYMDTIVILENQRSSGAMKAVERIRNFEHKDNNRSPSKKSMGTNTTPLSGSLTASIEGSPTTLTESPSHGHTPLSIQEFYDTEIAAASLDNFGDEESHDIPTQKTHPTLTLSTLSNSPPTSPHSKLAFIPPSGLISPKRKLTSSLEKNNNTNTSASASNNSSNSNTSHTLTSSGSGEKTSILVPRPPSASKPKKSVTFSPTGTPSLSPSPTTSSLSSSQTSPNPTPSPELVLPQIKT
eukprot:TRINITY_DN8624_c0_g1_i1.p1 TRINITY_DN8624_c0_g1~~TRINITY_DN8624_c0_g1_i1.p1  ORF type:complete len:492 (+),score=135.23 TRINITY_DN8624_c0_g1_i1:2-1477(+)